MRVPPAGVLLPALALGLLLAPAPVSAQSERQVTTLADGVYEIQHHNGLDAFVGGNTTVIVGERQVFVVDTPFLPSEAREDIAQIRQWTDKPVTFLLNTHFHNDHNLGNRAYMDAFPALTIIAHVETRKDMDLFGPGSVTLVDRNTAKYQQMLDSGKAPAGQSLTEDDKAELRKILAHRRQVADEIRKVEYQGATLTFKHDFSIDLGHREVQVKFLGRGNTAGDAVVYLPKERIVMAGDLVVHPIPYMYDGYPSEWSRTMRKLAELDTAAIVPGHGPIMRDKAYPSLVAELLESAVAQVNEALRKSGPALFGTVDDIKGDVDLSPFRQRFAGHDEDLSAAFDRASDELVRLVFREASLR